MFLPDTASVDAMLGTLSDVAARAAAEVILDLREKSAKKKPPKTSARKPASKAKGRR
mgnify:CR=1 FL=1